MKAKNRSAKPDSNVIKITNKANPSVYWKVAKNFLLHYDDIELHAVGVAMSNCVSASTTIESFGYATVAKIDVLQMEADSNKEERAPNRFKMIVKMHKSANFNQLYKKSKNMQEENQATFNSLN